MLSNWNHIENKNLFVTGCITHQVSQHSVLQSSVFWMVWKLKGNLSSSLHRWVPSQGTCVPGPSFHFFHSSFWCVRQKFGARQTWVQIPFLHLRYGFRQVPYSPQISVSSSINHRQYCLLCWFVSCRDNMCKDGRRYLSQSPSC